MEKDYAFCLEDNQWSSQYITIKTDGTVAHDVEDRKENQYYTARTWTWADFAAEYRGTSERGYVDAVAFVVNLLATK